MYSCTLVLRRTADCDLLSELLVLSGCVSPLRRAYCYRSHRKKNESVTTLGFFFLLKLYVFLRLFSYTITILTHLDSKFKTKFALKTEIC